MDRLNRMVDKWNTFVEKLRPGFEKTGAVFGSIGRGFSTLGSYLYKLRSIILAAPVAAAAVILAVINMNQLPQTLEITTVSIDTKADGALFGFLAMTQESITRELAVFGPLIVTIACLLLMMFSKRTLYPFIISLFTLCLPLVLQLFCNYPM